MLAINFPSEFEYILGTSPKFGQISMLNTPSSECGVPYPERPFETSMVFFGSYFTNFEIVRIFVAKDFSPICSYQEWMRKSIISKSVHLGIQRIAVHLRADAQGSYQFGFWWSDKTIPDSKNTYIHPLYFQDNIVLTYTSFLDIHHFLTSLFFPKSFCIYIDSSIGNPLDFSTNLRISTLGSIRKIQRNPCRIQSSHGSYGILKNMNSWSFL